MDENKKKSRDKKILAVVLGIILVLGIAAAILFFYKASDEEPKKETETILEYISRVVYQAIEPEDLGNPNKDVGVMLMNCDGTEMFDSSSNIQVVRKKGKYLEGTGSFGRVSPLIAIGRGVFKDAVDISAYKDGSLHISLYVSDVSKMKKEIWFEISSSGTQDKNELSWVIPRSVIKDGWNEFYLSIPEAFVTGTPNLKEINFYRCFELKPGYGLTILYDNVYVTNTKGTAYTPDLEAVEPDSYKETESKFGKMIMSCNTVNILRGLSNAKVTVKEGKFVEGTGAFRLEPTVGASAFVFNNPIDISAYQKGYVHISLYVSDASLLTKSMILELTSSGKSDVDEYAFVISPSSLTNGWNHLWLPFSSTIVSGSPNLKAINFLRLYSNDKKDGLTNLELILDDVYASLEGERDNYQETAAANGTMIASCNTINVFKEYRNAKVTTKEGEFVEGTGALKSISKDSTLMEGVLKEPVDISKYINGYVHFSIYVNDPKELGDLVVMELTSSGKCDADEYGYTVKTSTLKKGWNDCYIQTLKSAKKGNPDLSAINYIRIYCTNNEKAKDRVVILDNIFASLVQSDNYQETKATNGTMIASCNTANIFNVLKDVKVTTTSRQYVEGTGAFLTDGHKSTIMTGVLTQPVDLTQYIANGYIHFSLFVNDVSLLTEDVAVEVSSNEEFDKNEYQWNIPKGDLSEGWNEVFLKFSDAKTYGGTPDASAIKRVRIYSLKRSEGITTIVDNIYATLDNTISGVPLCECGKPIYGGDIVTGNCMCYFANAFNIKLTTKCKEGDFALQTKNPVAGMFATFKNAVNIADCKDGYVHIQLYVDSVSKVKNNVSFELSSSGTYDKDEYAWEIEKTSLKNGWNEIWLPMQDAAVTGSPNLKAINYFRMYTAQPSDSLKLILDDVYATPIK